MIYTIRTTSGREDIVIDLITSKVKKDDLDIKSVFHPAEIKGYIFIEGKLGTVQKAMQGLLHLRGIIDKPINLEEIRHFLELKKTRLNVDEDDIIEIIGGPFKGEKGRVTRINKIKDELTVELLEATIPIPVTIATEFVKMIKKVRGGPGMVQEKQEEKQESVFEGLAPGGQVQEEEEKPANVEAIQQSEKKKKKKSFLEELEDTEEPE